VSNSARQRLVIRALTLEYVSIGWGLVSATWSVTAGLLAGSLGVLGIGLNVIADVAGSVGLVWRFRIEQRDPHRAERAEASVSLVVGGGLALVAAFLATEAIRALVAGSAASESVSAMISAGAAAAIGTPLGMAKRRVGTELHSAALEGDGALTIIAGVLGAVALLALVADRTLGWWWADRVAALAASSLAAGEAARVVWKRPRP
jgi:divalent metal cation (Fe/Co/Zn/Cd) transporter